MNITQVWSVCRDCRRPVVETQLRDGQVFPEIKVTNVILTHPWTGPQVDTGDAHECREPQPYEIVVPLGLQPGCQT